MPDLRAAVILADGFEELETVAPLTILRRAGVKVDLLSLNGAASVTGVRGVVFVADKPFAAASPGDYDMVVLPGGLPGAHYLRDSQELIDFLLALAPEAVIGAICAAPIVLERAGLIRGCRVTCFPAKEGELVSAEVTGARVERQGRLVTAKAAGVSVDFALEILRAAGLSEQAEQVKAAIFA
jgi:protein deglycase